MAVVKRKRRMLWAAVGLILVVLLALEFTAFGQLARLTVEKPSYELIEKRDGFQLRRYPACVVAQVQVEGDTETAMNRGFGPLADYIFGNNEGSGKVAMTSPVILEGKTSEKIAMTSPVTMEASKAQGNWVSFIMPSQYRIGDLPKPKNDKVRLAEVPARVVAVRRFTGLGRHEKMLREEAKLRAALERDEIRVSGDTVYARYDPPWTFPLFRRNEVMIPVAYEAAQ